MVAALELLWEVGDTAHGSLTWLVSPPASDNYIYTICNQIKINTLDFINGVYCFCCASGAGGILNAPNREASEEIIH